MPLYCRAVKVTIASAIHWHLCTRSSVVYIKYTPSSLEQICSMANRLSVNIYYGTSSKLGYTLLSTQKKRKSCAIRKKDLPLRQPNARMAESVDALVSNTSGATHLGSSPSPGTAKRILTSRVLFRFYDRRNPIAIFWGKGQFSTYMYRQYNADL